MSFHYTFRPIVRWPGERTTVRASSPFRAAWSNTLLLLERELNWLDAQHVVLQADCEERMIRSDGMLRSDARLRSPGVILSFDSKHGPLSYPCDQFPRWQENVRAIALALEALRKVDRYGVTRRAEQYTGWKALPDPHALSLTVEQACAFLAREAGIGTATSVHLSAGGFRRAYKAAAARLHPDAGGDPRRFDKLQQAKAVLERVHGL